MKVPPLMALVASLSLIGCGDGGDGDGSHHTGDGGHTPVNGEPASLSGITSAHNDVRAHASPTPSPALPALTWSDDIAKTAQAWADRCEYEHSGNQYGENIYASYGSTITGPNVTASWASEADDYNYSNNSCSGICGHYTQIVWRSTLRLGCGVATCTKNSPFGTANPWNLVVCNYDPPGNFGNEKPY